MDQNILIKLMISHDTGYFIILLGNSYWTQQWQGYTNNIQTMTYESKMMN